MRTSESQQSPKAVRGRPHRSACHVATAAVLSLVVGGCGRVPEGNAPAGGTVLTHNGEPLTGVVGVVRFDPEKLYTGGSRGASVGWLESDGDFQIMTLESGDGVPVGDYRVVLVVQSEDGSPADQVHPDYRHFETTPWRATVDADERNHFVLTLDDPAERPVVDHGLPDHDY